MLNYPENPLWMSNLCGVFMNSHPETGTAVLVISLVISPVADGEGRSVMVWCSILLSLMAG
jgi:hypothetical protein